MPTSPPSSIDSTKSISSPVVNPTPLCVLSPNGRANALFRPPLVKRVAVPGETTPLITKKGTSKKWGQSSMFLLSSNPRRQKRLIRTSSTDVAQKSPISKLIWVAMVLSSLIKQVCTSAPVNGAGLNGHTGTAQGVKSMKAVTVCVMLTIPVSKLRPKPAQISPSSTIRTPFFLYSRGMEKNPKFSLGSILEGSFKSPATTPGKRFVRAVCN